MLKWAIVERAELLPNVINPWNRNGRMGRVSDADDASSVQSHDRPPEIYPPDGANTPGRRCVLAVGENAALAICAAQASESVILLLRERKFSSRSEMTTRNCATTRSANCLTRFYYPLILK